MPLTADSIVHSNTGGVATSSTSTPITVSLAGADTTDADNSVVVMVIGDDLQFPASVTGWTQLVSSTTTTPMAWIRDSWTGLTTGESSWDFTPSISATGKPVFWAVLEISDVSTAEMGTIDQQLKAAVTSGTTMTISMAQGFTYDMMFLGFAGIIETATATPSTLSGWTNGITEVLTGSQAAASASVAGSVVVLENITSSTAFSTTVTVNRAGAAAMNASDSGQYLGVTLRARGSRMLPDLTYLDGAEHGLVTGNTLGVANYKLLETASAGVSVSSTAARSGGSGWLLASTSAACNFTQAVPSGVTWPAVNRRHFRFPSLPAANTDMWVLSSSGGTLFTLRYVAATQKLGMKAGAGTEVESDQTITANQWFGVDRLEDLRVITNYRIKWAVDYNAALGDTTPAVEQTTAIGSGTGTTKSATQQIGWTAAVTATMHTDDAAGATIQGAYPIGDVQVLPVKVDPAGTPTVLTATTNFGVMTANGTVAAWNAANARDAIDDVPPDLSATRDAAVALLAHATDYAEFPMQTLDLTGLKVNVRGVKAVGSFWAAAATVATIRCFANDGTTTYTLFAEADPNADTAATPVWFSRMLRGATFTTRVIWSQAQLDALVFRFGSNDATPDIGVDCVVFEVAVIPTRPEVLFGEPGAAAYVEASRDPDTNGLLGFTVDSVDDVTVDYEVSGTPFSTGLITGGTPTYVPISSDTEFSTVNSITLTPS